MLILYFFYKAHFPGLHNEPVSTEGLDYLRIQGSDHWVVTIKADDPLSQKRFLTKKDLLGLPLILPERTTIQSELANWFGNDFDKLDIVFTSNLGTNAGVMALHGLGFLFCCFLFLLLSFSFL